MSASNAVDAIASGTLPSWAGAWAGLRVSRFYIGCRTGKAGVEWRSLNWTMLDFDEPWMLACHSKEYLGPLPGKVLFTPSTYSGGVGQNHQPVAVSCVPYTEERWNELQALADKLRWLQAHVMALFHVEGESMLLTERLLTGQPLLNSDRLLGG
jgi:hypothetical protein